MSSHAISASPADGATSGVNPLWARLPLILIVVGGAGAAFGAFTNSTQFGYSYLTAFMFFLSLCLGSLFLVLMHHLFDAGWSVPIRRFLEHIAFLLPVMGLLFLPIAFLAKKIYPWMSSVQMAKSAAATM